MLKYYVYLATNGKNTEVEIDRIQRKEIYKSEIKELNELERDELLALMKFCEIRVYEDLPVIACTNDELKMAYIYWRSEGIRRRKRFVFKLNSKFKEYQKLIIDYIKTRELF